MNLFNSLQRLNNRYERGVKFESMLPSVKFYRFDWSALVPTEEFDEDINPSFSKASADVNRCRGFWKGIYDAMAGVSSDAEANFYNLHSVIGDMGDSMQSVIQFVSMQKKQMNLLQKIASDSLGDSFDVIVVNGDNTKGKDSERYVQDKLRVARKHGKHVWIIAANMCQRSFSIPDINVGLLTFDKGETGPTIQRISRPLTAGANKSIGHIISVSIDGERDEKINLIVADTAKAEADRSGDDIVSCVKRVLHTTPIFQMVDGYIEPIQVDTYAREIFAASNSHRLIVNRENILDINLNDVSYLMDMEIDEIKREKLEVAFKKGATFRDGNENGEGVSPKEKDLRAIIEETLINLTSRINYSLVVVRQFDMNIDTDGYFNLVDTNEDIQDIIGCTGDQLRNLIRDGLINKNLLSLLISAK
jgi:hypothetical protein